MKKINKVILLIGLLFTLISSQLAFANQKVLDIQHWKTSNKARVFFVRTPQLPMVDIKVAFNAGSARDDNDAGIASFTNSMLNEGTNTKNADQIAAAFDDVGANFSASSKRDMAVVSLRSLTKANLLESALDTFIDVLSHPNFPEKPFQRIQQNTLASIKHGAQSPRNVADKLFYKSLYGKHPYAHPIIGTPESVNTITPKKCQQFYHQYYVAKNAVISIVGDIDKAQAHAIASRISMGLKSGKAAAALPKEPDLNKAVAESLKFPSSQTQIRIGQLGVTRKDADYFPLYVGNHILGGSSLVSKLHDEVREKRGLSYSVYSYFLPMEEKGPFVISLGTRNQQAPKALQVAKQTLVNFIQNGPSEKELTAAKQNIIGSFPLRLDSNKAISTYLLVIGFYHLPLNYLDTFRSKVTQVSQAQIKEAFKRRLHPEKMVTIQVGGAS